MSKAKTNLIRSTLILGAAGILVKILGAVFRIALTNLIHFEGMSYYQQAFPVYSALLIISTIGLPIAVSKLVSERVTADDWRGAYAVFRTARTLLVGIGVAAAIIMFSLSKLIAAAQGLPDAMYSLMAISPALFFVAALSAYRGFFGSRPFSAANDFLRSRGERPLDWKIV